LKERIGSIATLAAVMAGLSLLPATASAQTAERNGCTAIFRGQGVPPPPGSTAAGPPNQGGRGAAGRGAAGPGGGRGDQPAPAPAPRLSNDPSWGVNAGKPDFGGLAKGMWNVPYIINMSGQGTNADCSAPIEVPCNAAAQKIFKYRQDTEMKDDPEGFCLPPGVPRMMYTPYPTEIFQMPDRILFIYEGGAHVWRIIWMDGRKHQADPNPTYLGDSIGHWEGDTLVVDAIGFNTQTWLDAAGHPHGEKLHVIEKYTRPNMNTLRLEAIIEDPEFYTKPWTVVTTATWRPGQELFEYICQENNRDLGHIGAERGK
jgi:hypothetical protein